MSIITNLGGIPMDQTDIIRSALGKKQEDKLRKYGPMFIEGASHHIGEEAASKLWERIMHSSEYNFNKSHSAAYSVLAYISQYLKIYYPYHFWCAALDWDIIKNKKDDFINHLALVKEKGLEIEMPNINKSKERFYVEEESPLIISSLITVKGVGMGAAKAIIVHQPFSSFDDFLERVNKSKCKINNIISLIFAGVFDSLGDRANLLGQIYDSRTEEQREKLPSLSGVNYTLKFFEVMGFFETPIKEMKEFDFGPNIFTETEIKGFDEGDAVTVGGMIKDVIPKTTKKGDRMASVLIVDSGESIHLTVFPSLWVSHRRDFKEGNVVEIKGIKSNFNGRQNLVNAQEIRVLGTVL
jgi:DNA polymerase-3 subunit alpha